MIRFSVLRRTVAKYARVVLFIYVVAVLLVVSTSPGRAMLDRLGQSYIDGQDKLRQEQAELGQWKPFNKLGNISRHHRYAPLKTQVWQARLAQGKTLKKSHTRWANKNKRNIPMQLQLAQYYAARGEQDKSFKILQKLYQRLPDHPQLSQAYHQALKEKGHKLPRVNTSIEIEEYFKP